MGTEVVAGIRQGVGFMGACCAQSVREVRSKMIKEGYFMGAIYDLMLNWCLLLW